MIKKHWMIITLVLLLTVGFATINTVLNINGSLGLGETDFEIKFNRSVLDGANRPSFINKEGTTITFNSNDLQVGNSILDYEIVNKSRQYDAEVQVSCQTDAKNVKINNTSEPLRLNSGEVTEGSINMDVTKQEETSEVPSDAIKL